MSVTYTCRLKAVPTAAGKVRLAYVPLGDRGRLYMLRGPAMVVPPAEEMTPAEAERWVHALTASGYEGVCESTPTDAPLVEAVRTIEDEIPPRAVRWEFGRSDGGAVPTITLTNDWRRAIPDVTVWFVTRAEFPRAAPGGPAYLLVAGGESSLFGTRGVVLGAGRSATVAADPAVLDQVRDALAALSSENYWLSLRTGGREFARVSGAELAGALDGGE